MAAAVEPIGKTATMEQAVFPAPIAFLFVGYVGEQQSVQPAAAVYVQQADAQRNVPAAAVAAAA